MQSVVQTGPTGGGTVLNQNVKLPNSHQQNNYGSSTGSRPWDILPGQKPQGAKDLQGNPLSASTRPPTTRRSTPRATRTASSARPATRTARSARAGYKPGELKDASDEHGLPIPDEVGTGTNGAITENNLPGLAAARTSRVSSASTT